MPEAFILRKHLGFLRRHLSLLPASYRTFDSNRAAVFYFTLSTLDVLGKLDEEVDEEERRECIQWLYRLQLKSDSGKTFNVQAMGYCAPLAPNYGFLDTGCSVLGGIKVDPAAEDRGPSCPSKKFYISQYNLAYHWQRLHMVPHSLGFPKLLGKTFPWVSDCVAPRHIGHWPFETCSSVLRNRNLLSTAEDGDIVKLWTVSELSTRKRLLEFRLNWERQEEFDQWILADGLDGDEDASVFESMGLTSESSSFCDIRRSRDASRKELNFDLNSNKHRFCRTVDLKTPLLELQSWKPDAKRCQVLARSERELYLCDTESGNVVTLFQLPVRSLSFIPYMNDEILFLDNGGLIWFGAVGENFVRVKCKYEIESVAGSDHPRLIYAAGKDSVYLIDLRVGTLNGELLYSVPDFDDTSRNSYCYQYVGAFEKPTICQLCSIVGVPQMLLVSTSRKFSLVDERMRGLVCLELSHGIYDGGHYILCASPIHDPIRKGSIYPFYVMQHTVRPDLQNFALYRHLDGTQWSSLASIKRAKKPQDAAAFYREQPKYGVRIPRHAEGDFFGRGPTRAISFLSASVDCKSRPPFLFRMLDDGSLWYEQISIEDEREKEEKILWREADRIKNVVVAKKEGRDGTSFRMLPRCFKKKVKVFDVQLDLDILENEDPSEESEVLHPLDTHSRKDHPEPNVIKSVGCPKEVCGFRGSLGSSAPKHYGAGDSDGLDPDHTSCGAMQKWCMYDSAHISQTYVALCCLLILGDDLSRVERQTVLEGVRDCQLSDGSFRGQRDTENDMRFVYCAVAICYILDDFSAINMESMLQFIRQCVNYDGGISPAPLLESHGGSTFCAIASLALAGHLWDESVLTHKQIEKLIKWALWKQNEGFHGRTNKSDDSCYAFWIGSTLKILDAYMFVDTERLRSFIFSTQDEQIGGFGKFSDAVPDALHTCYGISALSLLHEPGLRMIYPSLNISMRAVEHLAHIKRNR